MSTVLSSRLYRKRHPDTIHDYNEHYRETHGEIISKTRRNTERATHRGQQLRWETKIEVLTHYGGGKCACILCGFSNVKALSIDHIDGNGRGHRRQVGIRGGFHFYRWLKRNGYPDGYQTLCMNCQFVKRNDYDLLPIEFQKGGE